MSGFGMGHNKLFGFADQQGRFVRTERTDENVLQKLSFKNIHKISNSNCTHKVKTKC